MYISIVKPNNKWRIPHEKENNCHTHALEKMLEDYKYDKEHSFIESEDKSIQCVFTEKYGLAKTPVGYCPLKQYTYYAGPRAKDKADPTYEPVLNHVNESPFHHEVLPTIPSDDFAAYMELYRKLEWK